jgi:predicted metal-dependent phosphotriesterase family hydrolase
MSKIMTVTGWIDSDLIKNTYVHEHLYTTATPAVLAENPLMALTDLDKIRVDLELFKQVGGNCIAEMTTIDYGRDVTKLKTLSEQSGVYVVAVGGFNKGSYNRTYLEDKPIDEVASFLIKEVTQGVDETGIRPGLLKIGTSLNVIFPYEEIGLRAVARASKATGIHITTHTQAGTMAREQLAMFIKEGVDPSCVILGHLDQLDDFEIHLELAKQGAFLGYDSIPKAKYNTKDRAIDFIIRLAKLGLHTQILISGDFARQDYFSGYGGKLGLDHLLKNFKPELRLRLIEGGLDADQIIDDLFIHNPRRALSFKETVQ